jgi:hypothetical protein
VPATAAQSGGDLGGDQAGTLGYVRPAVAQRNDAISRCGIVPALILPVGLGWLGGPAVRLDGHAELRVERVPVPGVLPDGRPHLAARPGQPMRSLHPRT